MKRTVKLIRGGMAALVVLTAASLTLAPPTPQRSSGRRSW